MGRITDDTNTLLAQAPMTVRDYLDKAVEDIDEMFGKGFAKKNPELVAAFIQACAIDFGTAVIARAIGNITEDYLHVKNSKED